MRFNRDLGPAAVSPYWKPNFSKFIQYSPICPCETYGIPPIHVTGGSWKNFWLNNLATNWMNNNVNAKSLAWKYRGIPSSIYEIGVQYILNHNFLDFRWYSLKRPCQTHSITAIQFHCVWHNCETIDLIFKFEIWFQEIKYPYCQKDLQYWTETWLYFKSFFSE